MMYLYLIILLLVIVGCFIFEPYLDAFYDYRENFHIILWYNWRGKRNYINLVGSQ